MLGWCRCDVGMIQADERCYICIEVNASAIWNDNTARRGEIPKRVRDDMGGCWDDIVDVEMTQGRWDDIADVGMT